MNEKMMTIKWMLCMNMQNKTQKHQEKVRKRRVGAMSNDRETRQKCDVCNRTMMWNLENMCKECRTRESSENANEENVEIMNNVDVEIKESKVRERTSVRRQRCGEI